MSTRQRPRTWRRSPRNCPSVVSLERQRVRAKHPAEPVQRVHFDAGPEPQAALAKDDEAPLPQAASGQPRSWDEIAPGHLVLAQETLEIRLVGGRRPRP